MGARSGDGKCTRRCKWFSFDMDLDPFCIEPSVIKSNEGFAVDLDSKKLHKMCPSPAHPLFRRAGASK
jgi:hypothetical protein